MKILIVSDTHGYLGNFETVLEKVRPIDMLIHCGDVERDDEYIRMIAECPVYMVSGNNDWGMSLDREIIISIGKYRVMITHGHMHSVYYGLDMLAAAAKTKGADIVMFGHTHVPVIERIDGVTLINPGSLTLPRQYGRVPTYAFMEIDGEGEVHFTISELNSK